MAGGSSGEGPSLLRDTYLLEILCGMFYALWISVNMLGENFFLHGFHGYIDLLPLPVLLLYIIVRTLYHEKQPHLLYNLCAIFGSLFITFILLAILNLLLSPPVYTDSTDSGSIDDISLIRSEAGVPLALVNNSSAKAQSWATIRDFVIHDHTVDQRYVYPNFTSGNYAVELHNNAERAGIKSEIANISYRYGIPDAKVWNGEKYHYINTFETTDQGRVFIDCTNEGDGIAHIAYVYQGCAYGLLSISDYDDPSYFCYGRVVDHHYNYTKYLDALVILPRFEKELYNNSKYYENKSVPKWAQDYMDFCNKTIRENRAIIQDHDKHPEWYEDTYDGLYICVDRCDIYY